MQAILENPTLPIFGVCLGHQLLGHLYNAKVHRALSPMHGLICNMHYNEEHSTLSNNIKNFDEQSRKQRQFELFHTIPNPFSATRYHSLAVTISPDSDVEAIAWSEIHDIEKQIEEEISFMNESKINNNKNNNTNGCVMALRHKQYPHWGVQFHPESVGTDPYGRTMIRNFCDFAYDWITQPDTKTNILNTFTDVSSNSKKESKNITLRQPQRNDDHNSKNDMDPPIASKIENKDFRVLVHKISNQKHDSSLIQEYAQALFDKCFSQEQCSFWLDSSSSSESCPQSSRFSIMGGVSCTNDTNLGDARIIEYYGKDHEENRQGVFVNGKKQDHVGTILDYLQEKIRNEMTQDLEYVSFASEKDDTERKESFHLQKGSNYEQLPFDFRGGYVGYLGYEVHHDTCPSPPMAIGDAILHPEQKSNPNIPTSAFLFTDRSIVLDHFTSDVYIIGLAKQEDANSAKNNESLQETIRWMKDFSDQLLHSSDYADDVDISDPSVVEKGAPQEQTPRTIGFTPSRSKSTYKKDIIQCHEEIRKGESYELCLINHLHARVGKNSTRTSDQISKQTNENNVLDPFGLYKVLRKHNPSPYAAFMKFDSSQQFQPQIIDPHKRRSGAVAICCSSPERFLSIRPHQDSHSIGNPKLPLFQIESKPIKGTCKREPSTQFRNRNSKNDAASLTKNRCLPDQPLLPETTFRSKDDYLRALDLQQCIKNRAENLMIVDLLRNDLNQICDVGSVHVSKLMGIESYETVHQLVSTIRGTLAEYDENGLKQTAIDALKACFPGGSMTGAPKIRTVQILDQQMERGAVRGPYAGSLGYVSMNGCMDMNIVIRTAVVTPTAQSSPSNTNWIEGVDIKIGAGGAITALSESEDEYNEMLLKARAVMDAINLWSHQMGLVDVRQSDDKQKEASIVF